MSAITQQAVAAFMEGRPFSKANTKVTVHGEWAKRRGLEYVVVLRLYGGIIARRRVNTKHDAIEVTTAPWHYIDGVRTHSIAARRRLNGIPGVSVRSLNGRTLHLNGEPWNGDWVTVPIEWSAP